jgi:hypothetical protein
MKSQQFRRMIRGAGLVLAMILLLAIGCDDNSTEPSNNPPNVPINPIPINDGSVRNGDPATLAWTCTDPESDDMIYNVYFGVTEASDMVADSLTEASYQTDALVYGVTYYWQVIAFDSEGDSTISPVWSFVVDSTITPQRYLLDTDIESGDSVNISADTIWVLSGFVFVEDGAVLSIEEGTVIKARPGAGVNASALIIARGGRIHANGTAEHPIIMTSEADDTDDPSDLPLTVKGLWGGLIILGAAPNNNTGGIGQIEGIPSEEPRGEFGGSNSHDNSGTVRYVSIRHGGSDIGAGNEINGLTLGSVGDGTTIEYVEVYSNNDDGVEFFGGTVNVKHIAIAFCGDDCYDYDEGFNGHGQFWFAIQGVSNGNRAGEHDGATGNEQSTPYAIPIITNATYIGSGTGSNNEDNDLVIIMRDNAGGKYYNSIFCDFLHSGLEVEDIDDASLEDSRKRLEAGDIEYMHNIWYDFGDGNTAAAIWAQNFVRTYMTDSANDNDIVDPQLNGISRTNGGGLDPRPNASGPAATGAVIPSGSFFESVSYKGAFDPAATPWIAGWTALSQYGFIQ